MGKAPAKPAGKAAAKSGKGGKGAAPTGGIFGAVNKLWLILFLMCLIPFLIPTLILLVVAMLPTLAALFAERGSAKQAWVSVGGMNFAGISYWLLNLWFAHHTIGYALEQLRSITPLVVAYSSSALGWAIYLAMPPVVNAITTVTSQRRVVQLSAQQRKLVEQWGDGVISREPAKAKDETASAAGGEKGNGAATPPTPGPAPARGR